MAIGLTEKNRSTNELIRKLETLSKTKETDWKEATRKLIRELHQAKQLSEKSNLLQTNINEISQEFRENLHRAFPKLTNAEIELCGLFRLGLDSKEISAMKNITMHSLRTFRYAIRKKLSLSGKEDLGRFLQDI